jgi:hypothetical protein
MADYDVAPIESNTQFRDDEVVVFCWTRSEKRPAICGIINEHTFMKRVWIDFNDKEGLEFFLLHLVCELGEFYLGSIHQFSVRLF